MPKAYQQAAWKALSIVTALTLSVQGSAFLFVPQIAQAATVPLFFDDFTRDENSPVVGGGWEEALNEWDIADGEDDNDGPHKNKEQIRNNGNPGRGRFARLHGENTNDENHADHPKATITHEIPSGGETDALLTFRWRGDGGAAVAAKLQVILGGPDDAPFAEYSIKENTGWLDLGDEPLALPNEVCDGGASLTFRSTANNNNVTVDIDDVLVTCEEEQQTARIRVFKYFDADQNGEFDEENGDYPLAGWRISLYNDRGFTFISDRATGEDGYTDYWEDVPVEDPNELVLQEDPSVQWGGDGWEAREGWESWVAVNPPDRGGRGFGTYWDGEVNIGAGGSYDFFFGNWNPPVITGYKFHDLDRDGVWYVPNGFTNEPGIEGWTIALGRVGEPEGEGPIPVEIVAMDLTGGDCNVNGVPDECDIADGENPDCDIPDECDIPDGRFDIDISDIEPGEYKLFEEWRDGWHTTTPWAVDSFFDITYRIGLPEVPLVQDSFFDVFVWPDGQVQISLDGEPVREALFGNRDAAPPVSQFDNPEAFDHKVIDTEIVSLELRGTSTDNAAISEEGGGRADLSVHRIQGDPDFDLLRILPEGDPDFDLIDQFPAQSFFAGFAEIQCPSEPIQTEIIALNLVSVDPVTVTWNHDWVPPEPGIYCLEVNATDNAGNVEHTAFAGPIAYVPVPVISEEHTSTQIGDLMSIVATWVTDHLATSRVIYDSAPHPDPLIGDGPCPAPNDALNCYGYAFSTPEDPALVLDHTVVVSGLAPATTYYYRTVSHGSPEAVGGEQQFTTPGGTPPGGNNGADFGAPPASPQGNNEEPASPPPPNEPSQPPPSPSSEQEEGSAPAGTPSSTPAGGSTSSEGEAAGEVLGLATDSEPPVGSPTESPAAPSAQEQGQPAPEKPSLMASLADLMGSWWWVALFAAIILAIVMWMRRRGESHA